MRSAMQIHPEITKNYPDLVKGIRKAAAKVGLDKLDCTGHYTLKKLGAKTSSPRGYPDKYTVCTGKVSIVGDGKENVLMKDCLEKYKHAAFEINGQIYKVGSRAEEILKLIEDKK